MPVATLTVDGTSTFTGWSGVGASPYISTDDADTSYVVRAYADGAGDKEAWFTVQDLPTDAAGVSNVVEYLKMREEVSEATAWQPYGLWDGTNYSLPTDTADFDTTYTLVSSAAFALAPNGAAWTPALVNGVRLGIRAIRPNSGNAVRCTYGYLSVTYVPASGGFAFLIGSLAAFGVSIAEMGAISACIDASRRVRIQPSEYAKAVQEFNSYKWPSYHFIGGISAKIA